MKSVSVEVYALESVQQVKINESGDTVSYYQFSDVMSYQELVIFLAKNHLNWLKVQGVIKDNGGIIKYQVTTRIIEIT